MNSMHVQPDGAHEVLISPPCPAGGGCPRWITAALHQADGWRAQAEVVRDHPDSPRTVDVGLLIQELGTARREQGDGSAFHHGLDDLHAVDASTPPSRPGCSGWR